MILILLGVVSLSALSYFYAEFVGRLLLALFVGWTLMVLLIGTTSAFRFAARYGLMGERAQRVADWASEKTSKWSWLGLRRKPKVTTEPAPAS